MVAGLVVAQVLSGCAAQRETVDPPVPGITPPTAPARPVPESVAPTDWSSAETVTVRLTEFRFEPDEIEFRAGHPYHLRLVNEGTVSHAFSSPGFFKAIAVRSTPAGVPEPGTPVATVVEVPPGMDRVVSFVALDPGHYVLECSTFLHEVFGMTGEITIRREG